jgi:hypothetical protein
VKAGKGRLGRTQGFPKLPWQLRGAESEEGRKSSFLSVARSVWEREIMWPSYHINQQTLRHPYEASRWLVLDGPGIEAVHSRSKWAPRGKIPGGWCQFT